MRTSLLLLVFFFLFGSLGSHAQKIDFEKTTLASAKAGENIYTVSLILSKSTTGKELNTEAIVTGCTAFEAGKKIAGTLINEVTDVNFECQFPVGAGSRQLSAGNKPFQVQVKVDDPAGVPIPVEQKIEIVRKLPSMTVNATVNGSTWYQGQDVIQVEVELDRAVSATLALKENIGGVWTPVGTTKHAFLRETPELVQFKDINGILKDGSKLRLEVSEGDSFASVLDVTFVVDGAEWKLRASQAFIIKETGDPGVKGSDKLKNGMLYIDKYADEEVVVYTQAMGIVKMSVDGQTIGTDAAPSSAHRFVIPVKLISDLADQNDKYHKLTFEGTTADNVKLSKTFPLVINNAPRFLGSSVSVVDEKSADGKTTKMLQIKYAISRATQHHLSFPNIGQPNITQNKVACDSPEANEILTGCIYTWKFPIGQTLKNVDGKQLPLRVDVINTEGGQSSSLGAIGMTSVELSLSDEKIKEFGNLATQIKSASDDVIKGQKTKLKGQLAEVLGFGDEKSIGEPDKVDVNQALDELINLIRGKKGSSAGDVFGTILKYAGRFVLSYFGGIKI